MFRFSNTRTPVLEGNTDCLLVVDDFDSKDFNLNDCGWPRNDISQLARATSQSQYDSIAKRLVEMASEGNIKPGTSMEDAISMIKPRYAQSPNEIENYLQMTNSVVMKQMDAAYQKALKDGKIKVDQPQITPENPSHTE